MEVEINQGVCNNTIAEASSIENGLRSSDWPILIICTFVMHRWGMCDDSAAGMLVTSTEIVVSADLGVSSKYSNKNIEDRSGKTVSRRV